MHGGVCGRWSLISGLIAPYTGEVPMQNSPSWRWRYSKFLRMTRNGLPWVLTHTALFWRCKGVVWSIIDSVVSNSVIRRWIVDGRGDEIGRNARKVGELDKLSTPPKYNSRYHSARSCAVAKRWASLLKNVTFIIALSTPTKLMERICHSKTLYIKLNV